MSGRNRASKRSGALKEGISNKGKNSQKKSPNFVPLNGLSQSARDRQMNNRTVRPPKNLNLVEGDPDDDMESQRRSRQIETFPSEYLLSSTIKEVNGMDYSNHSIEEYYRHYHSRSDSPEVSEDSTNSSSTNSSMQSGSREGTCVSNINSSTGIESSIAGSDLPADHIRDPQGSTFNEPDYNSNFINSEDLDYAIRRCRYSRNAAIMGLIRLNIISIAALDLGNERKEDYLSSKDVGFDNLRRSHSNKEVKTFEDQLGVNNPAPTSDYKSRQISDYRYLVPHPEDSEFYTTPLQAYGHVNDAGIDFSLPRLGWKTVMTPKQYFIREALDDSKFIFQKPATATSKPKPKINLPTNSFARSPQN